MNIMYCEFCDMHYGEKSQKDIKLHEDMHAHVMAIRLRYPFIPMNHQERKRAQRFHMCTDPKFSLHERSMIALEGIGALFSESICSPNWVGYVLYHKTFNDFVAAFLYGEWKRTSNLPSDVVEFLSKMYGRMPSGSLIQN